jgi:hypothetical protein
VKQLEQYYSTGFETALKQVRELQVMVSATFVSHLKREELFAEEGCLIMRTLMKL